MRRKGKKPTPEEALQKVARRDGVSVDEVRREITRVIRLGFMSSDPSVRSFWNGVPCAGEMPTPEETIAYLAEGAEVERA